MHKPVPFGRKGRAVSTGAPQPIAGVVRPLPSYAELLGQESTQAAGVRAADPPTFVPATSSDAAMAQAFGRDWPMFAPVWSQTQGTGIAPGFSFAALIGNALWLGYRRCYGLFAAALGVELATDTLLPDYSMIVALGLAVLIGLFGKSAVVMQVAARIEKIRAASGSGEASAYRIARAAGTDRVTPFVALLLLAGFALVRNAEALTTIGRLLRLSL